MNLSNTQIAILHNLSEEDKQKSMEDAVTTILALLGDDPNREGLKDTPRRVAKMYKEVFEGMKYSNQEMAKLFDKTFEDDLDVTGNYHDMVIIEDIPIFSYCEHHIAIMYNMKVTVAYLPSGNVIGLSKVARIADMVGRRLQLQERIGSDIAEVISLIIGNSDVAVIIQGEHSCMTARGIKKPGTLTKTSTLRGKFQTDSDLRNELMLLISK